MYDVVNFTFMQLFHSVSHVVICYKRIKPIIQT